jgi:hypothetical protein
MLWKLVAGNRGANRRAEIREEIGRDVGGEAFEVCRRILKVRGRRSARPRGEVLVAVLPVQADLEQLAKDPGARDRWRHIVRSIHVRGNRHGRSCPVTFGRSRGRRRFRRRRHALTVPRLVPSSRKHSPLTCSSCRVIRKCSVRAPVWRGNRLLLRLSAHGMNRALVTGHDELSETKRVMHEGLMR